MAAVATTILHETKPGDWAVCASSTQMQPRDF